MSEEWLLKFFHQLQPCKTQFYVGKDKQKGNVGLCSWSFLCSQRCSWEITFQNAFFKCCWTEREKLQLTLLSQEPLTMVLLFEFEKPTFAFCISQKHLACLKKTWTSAPSQKKEEKKVSHPDSLGIYGGKEQLSNEILTNTVICLNYQLTSNHKNHWTWIHLHSCKLFLGRMLSCHTLKSCCSLWPKSPFQITPQNLFVLKWMLLTLLSPKPRFFLLYCNMYNFISV